MTEAEAKEWCQINSVEIEQEGKKFHLHFLVSNTIKTDFGFSYGRTALDTVAAFSLVNAVKKAQKRMKPYRPRRRKEKL